MVKENKKITVAVGLSGGVDSSVAAYLLKRQGYNVIGIFMKNWEEDENCPAEADYQDVIQICQQLDIPFYTVNFAKEYYELVFQDLIDGLKKGLTPNPDILCNKFIKFDALLSKALAIGADYLATGHYAKVENLEGHYVLSKPKDEAKDQTYFLYTLKDSILKNVLFPLAELTKPQIRKIAEEANLITYNKKDSTGICFIGKRNFKDFIKEYIPMEKGIVKSINGKVLGEHDGVFYYTIGQRKGLGIGGEGAAWFVVDKNIQTNELILAQGEEHPALYGKSLTAIYPTWVTKTMTKPFRCKAKIRYRQKEQDCIVTPIDEGKLLVEFDQPQRAITPSQSIVFYDETHCLGGAIILEKNRI